ncbi:MAG: hypothetical protein F4X11_18840 [Acidobacteria bacterium]|nr:hypothetical protein [Acidobacteriota bacterium]
MRPPHPVRRPAGARPCRWSSPPGPVPRPRRSGWRASTRRPPHRHAGRRRATRALRPPRRG